MYLEPIATDLWEPVPDQSGYVRRTGPRTMREVAKDLNATAPMRAPEAFKAGEVAEALEAFASEGGFSIWPGLTPGDEFPEGRWIACYAVEGTNEGWWVHVDACNVIHRPEGPNGSRVDAREVRHLFLFKTWSHAHALILAGAATRCFYGNP